MPAKLVFNHQKFSLKIGKLFLSLFFLAFLLASSVSSQAKNATFSLESAVTNPEKNEVFLVQVFLNAPQPVNTVYLEIGYSDDLLSLEDISFSYSVFSNVVERDVDTSGMINLTAFTVSPYQGEHGLVATLKFRTKGEGTAEITILRESKIHLNDGKGTNFYNPEASKRSLLIVIGQTVPGGVSGAPLPSQPGVGDVFSGVIAKIVNFANSLFPKGGEGRMIAFQDAEKERIFFPEQQVMDFTKSAGVKTQKVINEIKTSQIMPYFVVLFLLIIIGLIAMLVIYVININRKEKNSYGS